MFLSSEILREFRIQLVAITLPCAGFTFPAMMLRRDVSGFQTDCNYEVRILDATGLVLQN